MLRFLFLHFERFFMQKRTIAAICREIQMVKSVVSDTRVKDKLVAELEAELAIVSGVVVTQGQLELAVAGKDAPKK